MPEQNIENRTKPGNTFAPSFADNHLLPEIIFNGYCLINNSISISKKLLNLYISYTLNPLLRNVNTGFTLNDSLFWSVKLTKNADSNKCKYSGYNIGFDCPS